MRRLKRPLHLAVETGDAELQRVRRDVVEVIEGCRAGSCSIAACNGESG